jgi:hypothetical protein
MSFAYRPGFGLGVGGDLGGAEGKELRALITLPAPNPLGKYPGFRKDREKFFTSPNTRELELMPNI